MTSTSISNSEKDKHNVNNIFKIPILYNDKVQKLNDNVVTELELTKTKEDDQQPIYNNVFKPLNTPSLQVIEQFANYYTTDTTYLKDTQNLVKSFDENEINTLTNKYNFGDYYIDDMFNTWKEIKNETGFCEKYLYIDWNFGNIKELNNNPLFLQLMSLYNITSPLLSLLLPIFVLIIPFIIIKIKGIELTPSQYIDILKTLISNHAIFKLFATEFTKIDIKEKFYLILSASFYIFSIYQNILVCVRFYSNMQKIHNYLFKFKKYLAYTIELMEYHMSKSNALTKYATFNTALLNHCQILKNLFIDISQITEFKLSFLKIAEIGHIMHTFYQLYNNPIYNDSMLYSFGFNGYFNMVYNLGININNNKLGKTTFSKNKKTKPIFKQMYYPKFINDDCKNIVKNDCNLNKNIVITGPNASGKTTTLKTALINVLLSQQFGYGCFKSLKLTPFDKIHCYLNIPDTSGRDSLFQAEARQCKNIINSIDENNEDTHFCIFDELYSGTNPEEAVVSAFVFMDYIVKRKNVTCMLTTHYIKLCKKLLQNDKIDNCNMRTIKQNNELKYTYKMQRGISKIKGGLKVLHDMSYPKEILDNASFV
jgi:hypothetical protein